MDITTTPPPYNPVNAHAQVVIRAVANMIYARQPSTISDLYKESLEDFNKLISIREEHGDTYYNQLFDSIRETYLYRDVSLGGASYEQERALHRAIMQLSYPYIDEWQWEVAELALESLRRCCDRHWHKVLELRTVRAKSAHRQTICDECIATRDFVLGMDQIQDSLQSRILTDIDILLTLYTTSLCN